MLAVNKYKLTSTNYSSSLALAKLTFQLAVPTNDQKKSRNPCRKTNQSRSIKHFWHTIHLQYCVVFRHSETSYIFCPECMFMICSVFDFVLLSPLILKHFSSFVL